VRVRRPAPRPAFRSFPNLAIQNFRNLAIQNFPFLVIRNFVIQNFPILVTQNFQNPVIQNFQNPVIQNFLVTVSIQMMPVSTSSTVPTRSAPPAHPTEMGCGRSPWPAVASIRSARSAIRPAAWSEMAQPANAREREHPNLRYACRTKDHSPIVQAQFKFQPADLKPLSSGSDQQSQTTQFPVTSLKPLSSVPVTSLKPLNFRSPVSNHSVQVPISRLKTLNSGSGQQI
jgi:hypothetical protein